MNINEFQKTCVEAVNDVDKKLRINHDNQTTIMHLIEEFGEIARQINNPKLNRDKINKENLEEEIADVVLLISKLADNNKINIEKSVKNKIEKLKQRHNI